MSRVLRTLSGLAIVLTILLLPCGSGVVLGQGGTGRETPKPSPKPAVPPAKKTTPTKKAPPRSNPPSPRQSSCSAQSPTQATGRGAYPTGRRHAVNLSGGLSMEMLEIPTGSFCMGSNNGGADEKPVHQVTINYSFYMGRNEVTQAQWQAVMGNNPSFFKGDFAEPFIKLPVEQVSWDDAQIFINKLNETNDGFRYRLPTEAEWEYACRAGTTGDYAGNLSEMAWYSENSGSKTHTVGGKQPNAWGLFDMHGNVWEWCQDWYHDTYEGAPTDGSAWLSGGQQKHRVLRGGAWGFEAARLRSASRNDFDPSNRYVSSGFRLVAVARTQ